MAWEKHGRRAYYYRAIRVAGRVRKVYCGGGMVGQLAAAADARRRADQQAQLVGWLAGRARLEEVECLTRQLQKECELLAEAVLLAAGFHRPERRHWRRWHDAWRLFPKLAASGTTARR